MITVKSQTEMDKYIVGHIIDPSAPNVEFKNITFDCKTIKDASGHIFVRQKTGEWQDGKGIRDDESEYCVYCSECGNWSEYRELYCGACGAKMENPETK